MPLIHFRLRLRRNIWQTYGFTWLGTVFLLLAARTCIHTKPPNVTCEETVYGPTGDSNRGLLAYRATELKSHTHRRPVIISICLIRVILESTRNHAGTDETAPLLPAAQTWTHTEPQNVKREEKLPIIFTPAEDRTRDTLHTKSLLRRYKSWLVPQGVQVCYKPNTNTYSGIQLWVLTAFCRWFISNEPPHDKTNKMAVRPAKTQISLGICPVWSESSLCAQ